MILELFGEQFERPIAGDPVDAEMRFIPQVVAGDAHQGRDARTNAGLDEGSLRTEDLARNR